MSVGPNELLMLDTNVVVHLIRQDMSGQRLLQQYRLDQRPERPLFSTVTEGEIMGLARCWKWGKKRISALADLLGEFVRFEASLTEVTGAYAELYHEDQQNGWRVGENDLWIAACAKATSSVLLTCDRDFLRISSQLVRVEYFPEVAS